MNRLSQTSLKSLIVAAALALAAPGAGAAPASDLDEVGPVYQAGGQYTAILHAPSQQWRLVPADGAGLDIRPSAKCAESAEIPAGLWLLTRDAAGQPVLVAPSATSLPFGHSGQIALVPCGVPGPRAALAVPPALIDWLGERTGAIYVEG